MIYIFQYGFACYYKNSAQNLYPKISAPLYLQLAAYDDKHDLFDPSYEGNICESVSVTYKGEEYFYVPPTQQSPNKSKISLNHFVATFMGMYMWSRAGAEEWMPYTMQFGDFESTQNYSNEKFIVKWPDGKVDVVVWSLVYKPKPRQKATFELTGTLNGKKVDYPLFIHRKF